MGLIQEADRHESARRKYDRIGGNLYYGRHWNVPMPQGRSAITCNMTKALIDHRLAIKTKQKPMPVIECADGGDPTAARFMRSAIMDWWDRSDMQVRLDQAELLGDCTRTSAIKYIWDPTLYNEAGDVDADVIPGWRLLIDPLARDRKKVRFIGDRALMTRARAMRLYEESAEKIRDGTGPQSFQTGGSPTSPIKDPWMRLVTLYPGVAAIDGLWTLAGYSSTAGMISDAPSQQFVEIVELYYKDPTLIPVERKKRDEDTGEIVQRLVRDEDGVPQFEFSHHQQMTLEDGTSVHVPMEKLVFEDDMETVYRQKYPFYRRTTMLLPDATVLDDCAWDYPHPYSLHGDGEVLEGLLKKGLALEVEDLQAQLNVSLSTMTDNLRFSSFRVAIAYDGAQLERNNLAVSPGDVLNVLGPSGSVDFMKFPELSTTWFEWLKNIVGMMQQLLGVTGVMQGESAGRVDSAQGYDLLAEIAGSRLTKDTQRMERAIADGMEIVGAYMQEHYTAEHGVRVEDQEGNVSFYRVLPQTLQGAFHYRVLTGSTLAWTESAKRARVIQEYNEGFRDKVSVWQELGIPGWRDIMARMLKENAPMVPPPPARTRQNVGKKPNSSLGKTGAQPR